MDNNIQVSGFSDKMNEGAELVDQNQQFRLCSECLVKVMMSFQHGCGMHPDFHVDMITLAADQKMGWQREVGK